MFEISTLVLKLEMVDTSNVGGKLRGLMMNLGKIKILVFHRYRSMLQQSTSIIAGEQISNRKCKTSRNLVELDVGMHRPINASRSMVWALLRECLISFMK